MQCRRSAAPVLAALLGVIALLGGCTSREPVPAGSAAALLTVPGAGAGGRSTADEYARRVVTLVNAHREQAGCEPLRVDDRLAAAARAHAGDMASRGYYEHRSPEGRDGGDRITAAGYRWSRWAENIHKGPDGPEAAVTGWLASPTHERIVADCALKDTGVGVSLEPGGPWWVQDFATSG
ncbi:CAP domain-containing protein [Streptomyces sp. t39]|uniref:CAP domain-containing protein n=1 Tax=Streptomyces sp. t39 TaxID=1828156 RepID=UPI0021C69701|nr:CAP domain-containing protein [Streptomyces sp. t39]